MTWNDLEGHCRGNVAFPRYALTWLPA